MVVYGDDLHQLSPLSCPKLQEPGPEGRKEKGFSEMSNPGRAKSSRAPKHGSKFKGEK